jgi:hypothetical protein
MALLSPWVFGFLLVVRKLTVQNHSGLSAICACDLCLRRCSTQSAVVFNTFLKRITMPLAVRSTPSPRYAPAVTPNNFDHNATVTPDAPLGLRGSPSVQAQALSVALPKNLQLKTPSDVKPVESFQQDKLRKRFVEAGETPSLSRGFKDRHPEGTKREIVGFNVKNLLIGAGSGLVAGGVVGGVLGFCIAPFTPRTRGAATGIGVASGAGLLVAYGSAVAQAVS